MNVGDQTLLDPIDFLYAPVLISLPLFPVSPPTVLWKTQSHGNKATSENIIIMQS